MLTKKISYRQKILVLLALSLLTYFFLLWSLSYLYRKFEIVRPWVDLSLAEMNWGLIVAPFLGLAATSFCILLERFLMRDKRSTFYLFLVSNKPNNSIKNDLFYLFLRISGLTMLMGFLLSGGSFYLTTNYIKQHFSFNLINDLSLIQQVAALVVFESVGFYLSHRLMHTRLLWEIHKVHHAATEYNVLLPYRNHPVDYWLGGVVLTFFHALAGGSFAAILINKGLNAVYQSMVHSRLKWPEWLDSIFITPQAHILHHSLDPRHRNRNFGTLCFWDKILGTYMKPIDEEVSIGIEDLDVNTGHCALELCLVIKKWGISVADALNFRKSIASE